MFARRHTGQAGRKAHDFAVYLDRRTGFVCSHNQATNQRLELRKHLLRVPRVDYNDNFSVGVTVTVKTEFLLAYGQAEITG